MTSHEHSSALGSSFGTILERTALPLFLFSALLCALLTASQFFILPRLAQVEVSGQKRGISDMLEYRDQLQSRISEAETLRRRLALSGEDPRYGFLKSERDGQTALEDLQVLIHAQVEVAKGDSEADIVIQSFTYDPTAKTVELTGDVRSAGTRSMTVLAAFVDGLQQSKQIATLASPLFTREDDPATGPHSPFHFTLHLK